MRAVKTQSAAALILLLCIAPRAAAEAIAEQTLQYAASYARLDAGGIEIQIRRRERGYVVTSSAKPSLLASMFMRAHVTETRFVRAGGRVMLDSGNERLAGGDGYAHSFRIDRELARIEFADGRHAGIHAHERLEAAAFPLLLMLRPLGQLEGARVREVSARRLRDYVYDAPAAEMLRVPAGEFACWKITRRRADSPNDSVSVWLQRSANPIPLQIVVHKRGKTSVLQLTERRFD
ncbi:MAG: DUF3108 domain-containing protein [Gammaproteobacteria bacterium]